MMQINYIHRKTLYNFYVYNYIILSERPWI